MSNYVMKINRLLLCIENPLLVEFLLILKVLFHSLKIWFNLHLIHCCFNSTSSYEKFHNEINVLKLIFKVNGYSIQFIDRCIKQFLQKLYVTKAIQDTVNQKQPLKVLLFVRKQL